MKKDAHTDLKDKVEQDYVFLRFSLTDIGQARRSLAMIRRYRRPDVIDALVRDTVIAYSRPFMKSNGPFGINILKCGDVVPRDQRPLHKKAITLRNKVVAHKDLAPLNPALSRWGQKPNHSYVIRLSTGPTTELTSLARELPDLVDAVYDRLQGKIRSYQEAVLDRE